MQDVARPQWVIERCDGCVDEECSSRTVFGWTQP